MHRLVGVIVYLAALFWVPHVAMAAPHAQPSVKDVALAFGTAIQHNDGGAATALLAPELRRHTAANQLPTLLGVSSPPLGVRVIRWAYAGVLGDATLSMRYADHTVAEHLYLHLYQEGWRITNIVPEDPVTLQREAEAAVVAFCDAAIRKDVAAMRALLTKKLAAHRDDKQVMHLLGLAGPLVKYDVTAYAGGPAGADIFVLLHSDGSSVHDHFVVINDRDGWRIAGVAPAR